MSDPMIALCVVGSIPMYLVVAGFASRLFPFGSADDKIWAGMFWPLTLAWSFGVVAFRTKKSLPRAIARDTSGRHD